MHLTWQHWSMTSDPPKQRRKPAAQRKDNQIRIRLTDAQKAAFGEAAARSGLDISNWLRMLGTRAVEQALGPEAVPAGPKKPRR